jgi:hypothetical protein
MLIAFSDGSDPGPRSTQSLSRLEAAPTLCELLVGAASSRDLFPWAI